jgi:hypothetical protein
MKNYNFVIKVLCLLIFLVPCSEVCWGQTSKAAKSIFKWFGKTGAKETGEIVAEKTVKEISAEMVEHAAKRNLTKSLTYETSDAVSDKIYKEITSDRIDNILSQRIREKALLLSGKKLRREVIDNAATEAKYKFLKQLGTSESQQLYLDAAKNTFKREIRIKATTRGALKHSGKVVLKEIDDIPGLQEIIKTLQQKYPSFTDDILTVEHLGNTRKIQFKGTASEIIIDNKGHFHCSSGSTMTRGDMNEFLNHPIANARYHVDNGYTQFTTDINGRTTQIECHSSELFKNVQRNKLASSQRDELRRLYGGVQGIDDAGHIQAHATGGSNELYNLLPMNKEMQRQGSKWAKLEQMELNAIKKGDDVWSKKNISYNHDGSYKIDVELKITDAVTGKTRTIRKSFDDLYKPGQSRHNVAKRANIQPTENPPVNSKKYRVPGNKNGHWAGPKGDSEYILDLNRVPSQKTYDNPLGKTVKELGEDLNDPNPSVLFRNGYPVFDKDGGTATGKPLQVFFEEGIDKYIDKEEVIRKKGKNINRQELHEEAFKRMAQAMGISVDELKVFKGDEAAARRLADEWGCSLDEVFSRCNNPHRIQRVLHECEDGKTIQLVPRLYHYSGMVHNGGIEKVASELLSDV